jgi:type I restriction-modification system DNA methylase subunit
MARPERVAEVRAEQLLIELLQSQGWDTRRFPAGEMLRQHEYKDHSHLQEILRGVSKGKGGGDGKPEAFLVDRATLQPLAVIEVKADVDDLDIAIKEVTTVYGRACIDAGFAPLAIALAGASEDNFQVRVFKWMKTRWLPITYDSNPIGWIPNRADTDLLLVPDAPREIRPSVPPPEVLADRADEINRLLRESGVKDEFRPAVVGAIMLALWQSRGDIRRSPNHILGDINEACRKAFWKAKKPDLAASLRVDEANDTLAVKARRITTILERLNVTVLTAEHDYLGQLYETFFHYTGGNTIGQYFTPRHIAALMADLTDISLNDVVLDPACGTGGFLIAAMNRVVREHKLSRSQMVQMVKKNLVGFDKEPVTAALCVANMILRGDGSTGVHKDDCFTSPDYPLNRATVVLMNPPFPHKKTDTPPERFVERALEGLKQGGKLAMIVPRSLAVKREKQIWREGILKKHTLDGVIKLPDQLFQPYASVYPAILLLTKGVPHQAKKHVFFARIENDGLRRKKNLRVPRAGEQLTQTLEAYRNHSTLPGFFGWATVDHDAGWEPGAYIPAQEFDEVDLEDEVATLTRSQAAFAALHAPQLYALEQAVNRGDLAPSPYARVRAVDAEPGTIGAYFNIGYGQKSLHSKDTLVPGISPVVSSSGTDNGCYGFFEFDEVIAPPFATIPSTGSIGEAHVQEWPCGVADDALILIAKPDVDPALLYVAAAVARQERWRFNYGRKITPGRIAHFKLPTNPRFLARVKQYIANAHAVKRQVLEDVEDAIDVKVANKRLEEIEKRPAAIITGKELEKRLAELES